MSLVQVSQAQAHVPVTVFHLQDRIDLGNFAELEQIARDAYNNGMRNLVMDLGQTSLLSSIGVRALVVLHKILSMDNGKHLKLANPNSSIRETLEISGVTEYIEIFDNVDEAVASFQNKPGP